MGWLKDFLLKTQLVTKIIATFVLMSTMGLLQLDGDNIALIAIFSGIAGSAATFLFTPIVGKAVGPAELWPLTASTPSPAFPGVPIPR